MKQDAVDRPEKNIRERQRKAIKDNFLNNR